MTGSEGEAGHSSMGLKAKDRSLRQLLQGNGVHPVRVAAGCDLLILLEYQSNCARIQA